MRRDAAAITRLTAALCVVVLLAGPSWAGSVAPPGRLDYQVVYRGVFSMGRDLPIADVALEAGSRSPASHALLTRMQATSEAYGFVESVYPIRYRFRSWSEPVTGYVVAFEAYEKTSRERHRLYRRQAGSMNLDVTELDGSGVVLAFDGPDVAETREAGSLAFYDRLGLLERIRAESLAPGAVFEYPVTNGKKRMDYRVEVEREMPLKTGVGAIPSWKLRIDATQDDGRDGREAAHRPVYLWISRDAHRIPLRAEVRHAVGLFTLTVDQRSLEQRLATAPD